MSLTVFEVLQNAEYNLGQETLEFQKKMGRSQLRNAIKQLEDNPDADAEFVEE